MSDQPSPARSFGDVADAYDRARPGYPPEAAAWLAGEQPVTVLELGAGTGKLTEALVALGHDVHATDPDEQMLAKLRERLPDVRTSVALGGGPARSRTRRTTSWSPPRRSTGSTTTWRCPRSPGC